MLKDLTINKIEPVGFMLDLFFIQNGAEYVQNENMFEHYETGIYRHDGFKFNFDKFIQLNCSDNIITKYSSEYNSYGICDNYKQVLAKYKDILNNPDVNYVIGISTVSKSMGFRYYGWGEYIGNQILAHEYFDEDTDIDELYVYHIYEID